MKRIPKKSRSVKGRLRTEANRPLRFTVRTDSLNRRYAVEKRTGRRVSLSIAKKEREKRQKAVKAIKAIPRYIPPKPKKPNKKRSEAAKRVWETRKTIAKGRSRAAKQGWETRRARIRSKVAKRGWETRRKREIAPPPIVPISILTPPERLIPHGIRVVPLTYTSIADRMALYPKVKEAAENAFARLQAESWKKRTDMLEGKPLPKLTREQQVRANIRDLIAERIENPADIDRVLEELWDKFDQEYSMHELYQIYFSPEVA